MGTRPALIASIVLAALVGLGLVALGGQPGSTTIEAARAPLPTPTPTPLPTATPEPTPTPTPAPTPTPTPPPTPTPLPIPDDTSSSATPGDTSVTAPPSAARPVTASDARSWPDGFDDLAGFVARTRGAFRFDAPDIRITDRAGMEATMLATAPPLERLPDTVRESFARADDVFRALGLHHGSFDLDENNRATAGLVEGVYNNTRHDLVLRVDADTIDALGGSIEAIEPDAAGPIVLTDPRLAEIAIHEITHAWQSSDRIAAMQYASRSDAFVARALIEGEAEWLTQQWRESRSPEEQLELAAVAAEVLAEARAIAPSAVIADTQLPYLLGRRLHDVVHDRDGVAGFDVLLNPGRTVTGSTFIDPHRWVAGGERVHTTFSPVPAPDGATGLPYLGQPFSAPHWFLVFATTSTIGEALDAARAVVSTSQPGVWIDDDGVTCIGLDLAARDGAADDVSLALNTWAAAAAATRSVTPTVNARWSIVACDPGPDVGPEALLDPLSAAFALTAVIDAETWAVESGSTPAQGRCRALVLLPEELARANDPVEWALSLDALDPALCPP